MSMTVLTVLVVIPTAAVVGAVFAVLWHERASARDAGIAVATAVVLAAWAASVAWLAARGSFAPPDTQSFPPIGITLAVVVLGLTLALTSSAPLRRLLTRQDYLIRLNVWRLEGAVFLMLMVFGQVPALWAMPAGIGDVIVGVTAPWVAKHLDAPGGRRRAVLFNLFGMADLIVAVSLGVMTSRGPAQVFHTTPTSELVTRFPLALVPTFLVPLAFALHVISLWQLLGGAWATATARVGSLSSRTSGARAQL